MFKFITILIVTFSCIAVNAQDFSSYTENNMMSNAVEKNLYPYLTDPESNSVSVAMYLNQRTGIFKEVRSSLITGYLPVGNSNMGASLYSDRKGKYLSRTRLYGHFSPHIQLTKRSKVAVCLTSGFVNYSIKSNTGGPSGSDFKLDFSLAMTFYTKSSSFAFSVNQILEPEMIPLADKHLLPLYLQGAFTKKYGSEGLWKGHCFVRSDVISRYHQIVSFGNTLQYNDNLSFIATFNTKSELMIGTGIIYKINKNQNLDINAGYKLQTALFDSRQKVGAFELAASFYIPKSKGGS